MPTISATTECPNKTTTLRTSKVLMQTGAHRTCDVTTPKDGRSPMEMTYASEQRQRIEAVRANHPIDQVIGRYVELRPSGRRLVGCCPFHEDRTPSLVVYLSSQSWFCFACDVGGDLFAFVQRIENISFAKALRPLESGKLLSALTRKTQPSMTGRSLASSHSIQLTPEHFTLLTAATEVYHTAIFSQPAILKYLDQRRIDLAMIRRHHIGYATGDNLARYFRFRGWDPEIANDLGLLGPRGEYFRERIVIPERRAGQTIYLVGRATQDYQKAKYLGLPGAAKPIYGLEQIRGAKEVFIVEGVCDLLTLVEWGYATIALLGSHLKREHLDTLADAERIFIATDSDEPGRKSAQHLAELLGSRARIVLPLPKVKDVNELARHPKGRLIFADLVAQVRGGTR